MRSNWYFMVYRGFICWFIPHMAAKNRAEPGCKAGPGASSGSPRVSRDPSTFPGTSAGSCIREFPEAWAGACKGCCLYNLLCRMIDTSFPSSQHTSFLLLWLSGSWKNEFWRKIILIFTNVIFKINWQYQYLSEISFPLRYFKPVCKTVSKAMKKIS